MIIVVGEWKKKIARILTVLVIIGVFTVSVPVLTGKLHKYVPTMGGWFKDEHPSGNPMRVEQKVEEKGGKTAEKKKFDQVLDQLVFKLQDFYQDK